MPFIVTTQELVLAIRVVRTVCRLTNHQQEMSVPGLHVDHSNIRIVGGLNVEEFPTSILTNVNDNRASRRSPTILNQWSNRSSCAQFLELHY